jgi:hypothetical protein
MKIAFAKRCAWHAIYVRTNAGRQFFSLGIDPTFYYGRARVFGQIWKWTWSFNTPRSRHWWKLDGRHGYWKS